MIDIFDEVKRELRADRVRQAWALLAPVVFILAAGLVVGVGGYEFFKFRKRAGIEASGRVFETGLEALGDLSDASDNDIPAARTGLARSLEGSYAPLAGMFLADLELGVAQAAAETEAQTDKAPDASGDAPEVSEALVTAIAARASAIEALTKAAEGDDILARMARLKLGYLLADTASLAKLDEILAPVLAERRSQKTLSAFGYLAKEILGAKAFESGDFVRAKAEYDYLVSDPNVDRPMSRRASMALALIDVFANLPEETAGTSDPDAEDAQAKGVQDAAAVVVDGAPGEQTEEQTGQAPAESAGDGDDSSLRAPSLAPKRGSGAGSQ